MPIWIHTELIMTLKCQAIYLNPKYFSIAPIMTYDICDNYLIYLHTYTAVTMGHILLCSMETKLSTFNDGLPVSYLVFRNWRALAGASGDFHIGGTILIIHIVTMKSDVLLSNSFL